MVLLGCPRKRLFLQWFYKVVREKGCFFIGFIRLSAGSVVFSLVLEGLSAKNVKKPVLKQDFSWTTRRAWFRRREAEELNWPHNSPSFTIESPLARPHSFASPRPLARNETISRLAVSQTDSPPQPPTYQDHKFKQ